MGVDAPTPRAVDVITHDAFMEAIADLEADVARTEAEREGARSGDSPGCQLHGEVAAGATAGDPYEPDSDGMTWAVLVVESTSTCVIGTSKRLRACATTSRSSQFERPGGWVAMMISSG